jgi:hypothetical protein
MRTCAIIGYQRTRNKSEALTLTLISRKNGFS